ncbi:MAG: c-type cytochrome [Alphaproteobacteria bacterium]
MEKWLGALGLTLTLVLGWTLWDASVQEWQLYQDAYYHEALRRAQKGAQKAWASNLRIEIKQLQLNGETNVERCVTCHLGYDNPAFRGFVAPLRTHSSLLKSHPPERFGCVGCHGGEGRAVTTLEAHGEGEVAAKPLLRGKYIQAACYNCHGTKTLPPQATDSVVRGRGLVNRYMCLACHKIDGEGGEEGPDLSTVGSQRSWTWIYAHTVRPQGVTAGSTMPVFSLKREEIQDVTIFLMTLLDSRDRLRYLPLLARRVVRELPAEEHLAAPKSADPEERKIESRIAFAYDGKKLFHGAGCNICHTIGISGGEVGPALTHIARKRNSENLERLLKDPDEILPGGKMPQLYLNSLQIKALVRYLGERR